VFQLFHQERLAANGIQSIEAEALETDFPPQTDDRSTAQALKKRRQFLQDQIDHSANALKG
jgi:hypothetical protein